jgi:hypothetical protein
MIEYELDDNLAFFVGLSLQLKTSFDQLKYVQDKMNDPSYETDFELFFNYYFVDGYNELVLNLSLIFENDSRSRFHFFNYLNNYIKEIDVTKVHEGLMSSESYADVKKILLKDKKELNSYRKLITDYRSRNIAHIDKNSFDKIIELSELQKPLDKFFETVHNLAYYKYHHTRFYTFSYMSELEEMMEKLRK